MHSATNPDIGDATAQAPVRVLIVDDSAIVRRVLSETLAGAPGIEVVGTAPDPFVARNKILALDPDVITLDIEMPRMDGLTFLRRIMRFRPKPVIVISSIASNGSERALEALRSGAVDVVPKPGGPYSVGELREDLPLKIRAAAKARLRTPEESSAASRVMANAAAPSKKPSGQSPARSCGVAMAASPRQRIAAATAWQIIAIGASTGGTQAVEAVLRRFPENCPPVVVTQHIPAGFSASFAQRLNTVCPPLVKEASDGDALLPGQVLIAPGGYHLRVSGAGGSLIARLDTGPKVCYQRPSVDVLFASIAMLGLRPGAAILLTGMGSDGAAELATLREAGFHTIAESEETCVVFGMPREAIRRNAAAEVLPLHRIAQSLGF